MRGFTQGARKSSLVCLDGMTLNIPMIINNRMLMVMAWVWALTIVELIANC